MLYNLAIGFTTAARASLALATLPLHTMVVGALLGIEPLSYRKSAGVGIAMLGVIAALASGLAAAPQGAWRGELIMTARCSAWPSITSGLALSSCDRARWVSSAMGMGAGAAALVLVGR